MIKIVSYNTLFSLQQDQIINNLLECATSGVIIFCLQEVVQLENKPFIIDRLLEALGNNWTAACHLGEGNTRFDFGTCIVWNTKSVTLKQTEKFLLPKIETFGLHERLFTWLMGHKVVPAVRRIMSCVFTFENIDMLVTSVHLDHVGGTHHRIKQLTYLLDTLQSKFHLPYEIYCGDFNSFDLLQTGNEKKELHRAFGTAFVDVTKDILWTADLYNMAIPENFPYFVRFIKIVRLHIRRKLDYIWTKNFTSASCQKLSVPGSDHYPIMAELTPVSKV